jgi:glycosyltransferase involved in cell wall biosynthesis
MSKTYEKLNAVISVASNSPGAPTGYGQQADYLVERLVRAGVKTAAMSNYGLEGGLSELKVKGGKVAHYPKGLTLYSDDILPDHHAKHRAGREDLPHAIITLYDQWVYRNPALDEVPIIAWTPLDHVTLPSIVGQFLQKPNVTPVTMAPHGKRQLDAAGIENVYIPHGIDTKTYDRVDTFDGIPTREFMGIGDEFVIGMVAANKANRYYHRKAYPENLAATALFMKEHPDSLLYIHTDASPALGGFDLGRLLASVGISPDRVIFPDPVQLRYGYTRKQMAALYSSFDVLLAPSYGEGFGIPTVEAQACGVRAIASSWAASSDLVAEDGWLVDGHVFWDEGQAAWWKVPDVSSIATALKLAYEAPRGPSDTAREFALQFDVDKVWAEGWLPFLKDYLGV